MKTVGRFFLRAQAWQIFFIVVGVFAVGQIAFLNSITGAFNEPFGATTQRLPLEVIAATCSSAGFFWLWFLGTSLNSLAHPNRRRSIRLFALALMISVFYAVVLCISAQNPRVLNRIGLLAVVAAISSFYMVRFVARAFLFAETGKDPLGYEYIATFLLLVFFPFGIWVLQPRINELYAERGEVD